MSFSLSNTNKSPFECSSSHFCWVAEPKTPFDWNEAQVLCPGNISNELGQIKGPRVVVSSGCVVVVVVSTGCVVVVVVSSGSVVVVVSIIL